MSGWLLPIESKPEYAAKVKTTKRILLAIIIIPVVAFVIILALAISWIPHDNIIDWSNYNF